MEETHYHPIDPSALVFLDGAKLELCSLVVSHNALGFLASGLPGGQAQVWFWSTQFVDTPMEVHDVRIRIATTDEMERNRRRLPERVIIELERSPKNYLTITCREGSYTLIAKLRCVTWVNEVGMLAALENPETDSSGMVLCPGGPTISDLAE